MSETKFEVGDEVSWMGAEGCVINITEYPADKFAVVRFKNEQCSYSFLLDGRLMEFHKEPSLKLIKKAKKKLTVECWVNAVRNGMTGCYYNRCDAHRDTDILRERSPEVTTIHLSKEIEI